MANSIERYILYCYENNQRHNKNTEKNPNVSWHFVQKHPEINWDYDVLSRNPNITWNIISSNLYEPWDFNYISQLPIITLDICKKYKKEDWDTCRLLSNPNITLNNIINSKVCYNCACGSMKTNHIVQNPVLIHELLKGLKTNGTFDYKLISNNLPVKVIDLLNSICWNETNEQIDNPVGYYLSVNTGITEEIIDKYPFIAWDYINLSNNSNISWNYVYKHIDKNWDFFKLSDNIYRQFNLSEFDIINDFCSLKNSYYFLSNYNIKWDVLKQILDKYPNLSFDAKIVIGTNPNITYNIFKTEFSVYFNWHMNGLSKNPNFSFEHMLEDIIGDNFNIYKDGGDYIQIEENLYSYSPIIYSDKIKTIVKKSNYIIQDISQYITPYVGINIYVEPTFIYL